MMQAFCCCATRRRGGSSEKPDLEPPCAVPPPPSSLGLIDIAPGPEQAQELRSPRSPAQQAPTSSQISPREAPAELCQLVADCDSDDDDNASLSARKSPKTLDAVRTKLIQHMSQNSDMRRHSRTTVGHSEEELARRAELRRFRQKRIQDELESGGSIDEGSNTSHRSTRYLSPLIDLGQPRGGPRDTIEFTVDNSSIIQGPPAPPRAGPLESSQRQGSCPQLSSDKPDSTAGEANHDESCPAPDRTSTTSINISPRPATTHSAPRQKLVGLNLHNARLERAIGADNDFDIRHGSHAWDDQSTLGIWLIAQGLRSRDTSLIRLGEQGPDAAADQERMQSPSQDIGGIDSVLDTPTPSRENSTTMPLQRHEAGGALYTDALRQIDDNGTAKSRLSPGYSPLESAAEDLLQHANKARHDIDNPSSNYPSVMPSFQPSPAHSTGNSFSLSPQDIENLELSPFECRLALRSRRACSELMPWVFQGKEAFPYFEPLGTQRGKARMRQPKKTQ